MTNKEKVGILFKYFGDKDGNIDLSYIDFGNRVVFNNHQKANIIYNYWQKANVIYNSNQEAKKINNSNQVIKSNYENMSKEELIKEIRKLKEESR